MSIERIKMRKQLGLLEGVAIILGIIFGSGIFISPKEVLEKTGSVWGAISVWIICGLLATLGAMSYAELGKRNCVFICIFFSVYNFILIIEI